MYANRAPYAIAIVIVFTLVLIAAIRKGADNRIMLPASKTVAVQTPEQAFTLWQQSGVKGRTLILFDEYPHMNGLRNYPGPPQLTRYNLIEYSIFKNIIRKIYLIVPEDSWNELLQQKDKRPLRSAPGLAQGMYLFTMSGVPLIATTPSSLGQLSEDVLVYINKDLFDPEKVIEQLRQKKIHSDIIISCQGINR